MPKAARDIIDRSEYFAYSMFQDARGKRKVWKKTSDIDQSACVCVYIDIYGPMKFGQCANLVGRWILQKIIWDPREGMTKDSDMSQTRLRNRQGDAGGSGAAAITMPSMTNW